MDTTDGMQPKSAGVVGTLDELIDELGIRGTDGESEVRQAVAELQAEARHISPDEEAPASGDGHEGPPRESTQDGHDGPEEIRQALIAGAMAVARARKLEKDFAFIKAPVLAVTQRVQTELKRGAYVVFQTGKYRGQEGVIFVMRKRAKGMEYGVQLASGDIVEPVIVEPDDPCPPIVLNPGKIATVYVEANFIESPIPEGLDIVQGDWVSLVYSTHQIIAKTHPTETIIGNVTEVVSVLDGGVTCEIKEGSSHYVVCTGGLPLKGGDRVVWEHAKNTVLQILPPLKRKRTLDRFTRVAWGEIGGLDRIKEQVLEEILRPRQLPELYGRYRLRPANGILLFGPPGCGKTLIGKAIATEFAARRSTPDAPLTNFLLVKGPEILTVWLGESERGIRELFAQMREHFADTGESAVLYIDEADAILQQRTGDPSSAYVDKTLVPMFLAEIDGFDRSGGIVILSTNRQDLLDPAILRDGRMDVKIHIPRPNLATAQQILDVHLRDVPIVRRVSRQRFTADTCARLFDPLHVVSQVGETVVTLADIASGALIEGVVTRAKKIAVRRDIDAGAVSGIRLTDMLEAIKLTVDENRRLDHSHVIAERSAVSRL